MSGSLAEGKMELPEKSTYGSQANTKLEVSVLIDREDHLGLKVVRELLEEQQEFSYLAALGTKLRILIGNPYKVDDVLGGADKDCGEGVPLCRELSNSDIVLHIDCKPKLLESVSIFNQPKSVLSNSPTPNKMVSPSSYMDDAFTFYTEGFPAANNQSEELARALPLDLLITKVVHFHALPQRNSAIDWAYFHGQAALTVRFRYMGAAGSKVLHRSIGSAAKNLILYVLGKDMLRRASHRPSPLEVTAAESVQARAGFIYADSGIHEYMQAGYGERIAEDEVAGEVVCPYDEGGYILLLNRQPKDGEIAFVWGLPVADQRVLAKGIRPGEVPLEVETMEEGAMEFLMGTRGERLTAECPALVFGSPAAQTRFLITVAIHGNEHCGVDAVNELIQEGAFAGITHTQVKIVLGNPQAYAQKVRFVEENLNRIIAPHHLLDTTEERRRAREIAREISQCHVYLDLHSTSADSPPFALPAKNLSSERLSRRLPVAYIVRNLAHTTKGNGTSLDWALYYGKTAVTVECGQHDGRATVLTAKAVIRTLLFGENHQKERPMEMECSDNVPVREGFTFARPVRAFSEVQQGEVIARDDGGEIRCPYTRAFLVMPTGLPIIGEEAWFWGRDVTPRQVEGSGVLGELYAKLRDHKTCLATRNGLPAPMLSTDHPLLVFGQREATMRVTFSVCLYGDETAGMHAVNQLIANTMIVPHEALSVRFVLAYPEAVQQGKRFLGKRALNRCFVPDVEALCRDAPVVGQRAQFLARMIEQSDVYIGLGTSTYDTPGPMILPVSNASSEQFGREMQSAELPALVYKLAHETEHRTTSMDYAYDKNKTALTVICGRTNTEEAVENAKHVILRTIGLLGGGGMGKGEVIPRRFVCTGSEVARDGFQYVCTPSNLRRVAQGEVVAVAEGHEYCCPHKDGAYMVLPNAGHTTGEEVFWWATPEPQ